MSGYQVGKLLFDMSHSPELVEKFQTDLDACLERYNLSPEEREAIQQRDLKYLYEIGVHPMVMLMCSRLFGVNMREYVAAITGKKPEEIALP